MAQNDVLDDWYFDDAVHYLSDQSDNEVVGRYYASLDAQMAAARLRTAGIPCFLANTTAQSVLPHLQLVVRLHVRPQDLANAKAILGEAALDTEPLRSTHIDRSVWLFLGILIGLVLAYLFIKALQMD